MSEQAYEKGQTRDYAGMAVHLGGGDEPVEIEGRFVVLEVEGDSVLLEDVRADELCETPKYSRELTRYRIDTKA